MPKIIANLKERILTEAKKQTDEAGYAAMTIRSVVKACGISVGTFYNYFPSKEVLVASFILKDWIESIGKLKIEIAKMNSLSACERIYGSIVEFSDKHSSVFKDSVAERNASASFGDRHIMLRGQIAQLLDGCCKAEAKAYTEFMPEFLAEVLIDFAIEGRPFPEIYDVINVMFI